MKTSKVSRFILPLLLGFFTILIVVLWSIGGRTDKSGFPDKVSGRREGCLFCHSGVEGFSPAHNPQAIGCFSCHSGQPFSLNKDNAHQGMILVPGNLAQVERTCGTSNCHPEISENIHTSLMSSGKGIVAVNRFVFGEASSPNGEGHLSELGHTPADSHLRGLCASCHLNHIKREPAPVSEQSRGGGCVACHIRYTAKAIDEWETYRSGGELPKTHPALTIEVSDDHCFGCHSRSGRISTNYQGWHESLLDTIPKVETIRYRQLEDGRVFEHNSADIHFERGLSCIDCHTWRELMGDGNHFNHQEEQVEIGCEDCHFTKPPGTTGWQTLSNIDLKILSVRKIEYQELAFVTTQKTGRPLLNVILDKNGKPLFTAKNSAKEYHPKPPLPICSRGISGHERLTCQSCHTAWAPQCISCHTRYERDEVGIDHLTGKKVQGRWVELSADFYADPPVLGVLESKSGGKITTFIPGMILTIESGEMTAGNDNSGSAIFRRLYAPTAAHTTTREGRPCQSCHNEPLTLGYGRGTLFLRKAAAGLGSWHFKPYYDLRPEDQLPYDAWIGFLQTREEMTSTRSNARPLNVAEQKRILTVGVCLTCHEANPKNLVRIYSVFWDALKRTTKQCLLLK